MSIDKPTHLDLVAQYCFYEGVYSLSFRNRIRYNLGLVMITFSTYSKELDVLSDKELEERIASIKIPWWNSTYEKIAENYKGILFILLLILSISDAILRIDRKFIGLLAYKYSKFHIWFNKKLDKYCHNNIIVDMSPYDSKKVHNIQKKCNDHWNNLISIIIVVLINILIIIVYYKAIK